MARFRVEDMSCAHCVATITDALEAALPGAAIAVDLDRHEVRVDGDAGAAETAIRAAGYAPERLAA